MPEAVDRIEVPHFSLAERDARWARVRRLMERARLDVIVAPRYNGPWDGGNANARYLSGIGMNGAGCAVVFPLAGEVTAIIGPVPSLEYWLGFQDWVTDIRYAGRNLSVAGGSAGAGGHRYGGGAVERLRELGVERGRIGVVGLAGTTRAPEGIVPHGAYMGLCEAFPEAGIVDAGSVLNEARVVKSAEEITFMEQSARLVEHAVVALRDETRPGVTQASVYADMLATMVKHGGELPTMLLWSAGTPQPMRNCMMPDQRKFQAGDVIGCEIDGNYAGYRAQVTTNAILGVVPPDYADLFAVQQSALQACYEHLKPGAKMGDFIALCTAAARGTSYSCQLIMHSRGLGDDGPMIIFGTQDPRVLNWPIEENNTFIVKPIVRQDEHHWVCWGDTVVVTAHGPRRLTSVAPEIIEIG